MRMLPWAVWACVVGAACSSGMAQVVAYDALSGPPGTHFLSYGNGELADDTTLDPAAGLLISSATIRTREPTSNLTFDGTIRVSVYADSGGLPGALLTTLTLPLHLPPETTLDLFVDLPDVLAPSANVWTAAYYSFDASVPAVEFQRATVVGSSTSTMKVRNGGVGAWSNTVYDGLAVKLETVPGPGGVAVLGMGVLVLGRRRRVAKG